MILNVPYYSQKINVSDPDWREKACGATCLKMFVDFYNKNTLLLDELILLGVEFGAYGPSGWIHQGLVDIAGKLGVPMERVEFKSDDKNKEKELYEEGISRIIDSLDNGNPVLVSAIKKFKEVDKFHMMVLVGFEGDTKDIKGFYYHDSDAFTIEEGKNQFVPIEIFKKHWRKMAIFIHR